MRRSAVLAVLVFALAACGGGGFGLPSPSATPPGTPGGAGSPAAASPSSGASAGATADAGAVVTLAAAGDVMLGRSIGDGIGAHGASWALERVASVLREADVAFVNLESPLSEGGEPADKDFVFRGPPEGAKGLADAGVDIVSLANNHVFDYGFTGLRDTWAALNAAGVAHAGSGENFTTARAPVIIERNGLRLAFLAYVNTPADSGSGFDVSSTAATADRPGVAWLSPEAVAEDVAAAKRQADVAIVSMHTGYEYTEAANELQTLSARAAVDAGASVVLGGHPHVLQGIETYNGGLIIYSLGNFVFDFDYVDYSYPGLPSALSAVLRVRLTKAGVAGCEVVPVVIDEADGRPRPVEGDEAAPVLERLRRLSDGSCGL